jgi:hypothetical protein
MFRPRRRRSQTARRNSFASARAQAIRIQSELLSQIVKSEDVLDPSTLTREIHCPLCRFG